MKPLAIDLFCGLGGWSEALLAEGYDVVGFDIERHVYGEHRYPAQLVIQDVLTLHGSQFRDAALIVASPPCQFFSYCAMPWTRAKKLAAEVRADPVRLEKELALFKACFRIQREACEAAGRHIPLIVENVRGAQPWVGRARWNFGSFYLWGNVPALMPPINPRTTLKAAFSHQPGGITIWEAFREREARKVGERIVHVRDGHDHTRHLTNPPEHGVKQGGSGRAWFDTLLDERCKNPDGVKNPGCDLTDIGFNVASAHQFGGLVEGVKITRTAEDKRQHIGTKRKFASAMIAKIPQPLAQWIARAYAR